MFNIILTVLSVGFGFYLGRLPINNKVVKVIQSSDKVKKGYAEDFVVDVDEALQEATEIARKEQSEERIDVKSFTNGRDNKTER